MAGNVTATKTASEERLYTIGEVSRLADLKPFVLRYWESEIPMLQPTKDDAGRRVYRQQDVDMVFRIKRLLYDEGYTIAGARRHLREKRRRRRSCTPGLESFWRRRIAVAQPQNAARSARRAARFLDASRTPVIALLVQKLPRFGPLDFAASLSGYPSGRSAAW